MIQRIIHRLLLRRHFWRHATFSEVAELYASRTIRLFALRMVAVFTSIYLYQEGYSILFITLTFAAFFAFKIPFAWPSALLIARFGPKRSTFVSNILAAISMLFLPFIPEYGVWALAGWSIFQASSTCLYDMCYLIGFSKVKNAEHAGKEIAYMNILEKIATGLGPVLGGILAFVAGPQVVMIIACILFLFAATPLFWTIEPMRIHQKLQFSGFPWRTTWRSLVAETAVGFDWYATGTAWSLFMLVIVFPGDGNELYAKIGALSSVTLVAALAASYTFGKLIDSNKGGQLLKFGTILNSLTHIMRAFVTTPVSVVFANLLNEAGTTAYAMPFTRGLFDTADISGKRIVYLFFIQIALNVGASLAALLLALLIIVGGSELGLRLFFVAIALITLLIATPRFAIYRK